MARASRTVFTYRPDRRLAIIGGLSLTGAMVVSVVLRGWSEDHIPWWVALLIFPVLGLYYRDVFKVSESRVEIQADRQKFASAVYENLAQGEHNDEFCLYLRPFFCDAKFVWSSGSHSPDAWSYGPLVYFENLLCEALDRRLPVIQVGGDLERFGPGIVRVPDETWQDAVLALAKSARAIIVIPFAQPATAWEIGKLRELGWLTKTVFLVPPYVKIFGSNTNKVDPNGRNVRRIYGISRDIFAQCGLEFPKVPSDGPVAVGLLRFGGAFTTGNDGKLLQFVPFTSDQALQPSRVGSLLRSMLGLGNDD